MEPSSRAPLYDLFKLIIAVILLLLFLFFGMRPAQVSQTHLLVTTHTPLPAPQSPTVVPVTSTSTPLTETPALTTTPFPTTIPAALQTSTAIPSPTESPVPEITPTPSTEIPAETNACQVDSPSRLQVGRQAMILRYLNFRSSPGFLNNWIMTNNPGTQVEIIGGPECTRYEGGGAYLWWQIRLPNGLVGWSAEASAAGTFYFIEPTP
jgi:hypothetical protein